MLCSCATYDVGIIKRPKERFMGKQNLINWPLKEQQKGNQYKVLVTKHLRSSQGGQDLVYVMA